MKSSVRLALPGLPLDPVELAKLGILDRTKLYADLGLHPIEREAAEAAVRQVLAGRYGRGAL